MVWFRGGIFEIKKCEKKGKLNSFLEGERSD
jgi:hypothetical protein